MTNVHNNGRRLSHIRLGYVKARLQPCLKGPTFALLPLFWRQVPRCIASLPHSLTPQTTTSAKWYVFLL